MWRLSPRRARRGGEASSRLPSRSPRRRPRAAGAGPSAEPPPITAAPQGQAAARSAAESGAAAGDGPVPGAGGGGNLGGRRQARWACAPSPPGWGAFRSSGTASGYYVAQGGASLRCQCGRSPNKELRAGGRCLHGGRRGGRAAGGRSPESEFFPVQCQAVSCISRIIIC